MRFDLEMFNMFEPSDVITVIMAFQYLVSISREMSETPPTFHLFLHQASGPIPQSSPRRAMPAGLNNKPMSWWRHWRDNSNNLNGSSRELLEQGCEIPKSQKCLDHVKTLYGVVVFIIVLCFLGGCYTWCETLLKTNMQPKICAWPKGP